MKKYVIIASLFLCSTAFADTMIVKVPVLNVRSCPSTNCSIVKKLKKGDKVSVNSTNKEWATIGSEKLKEGYVVKRSLRSPRSYTWLYVIGILLVLVLIGKYESAKEEKIKAEEQRKRWAEMEAERILRETQCPKCNTPGAMQEVSRKCVDKKNSKIVKVTKTQYKDYTKTHENLVPATTYIYKVTNKCSNCGHTVVTEAREKVEN